LNIQDLPARVAAWLAALPVHTKVLLSLATTLMVVDLLLKRFAPRSRVRAGWTKGLEAMGHFWTAIILSVVYFVSVAVVGLVMRLLGKDPLDRCLDHEATYWRPHDPNPLGPQAAARHQF
jgi:saxitoxin biosynthesis operon SxtJ-like protein